MISSTPGKLLSSSFRYPRYSKCHHPMEYSYISASFNRRFLIQQFKNISKQEGLGQFVLSSISQIEQCSYSDSPSVKMVLSGNEHYRIDGRPYTLGLQRFLVVDKHAQVELNIKSEKEVKGVCIFPDKELLNEVAKTRLASGMALLDDPFTSGEFALSHNQYKLSDNRTGRFLNQYIPALIQRKEQYERINFEHFYSQLAECMIEDQLELEGRLKPLPSVKRATREELYRRVTDARAFIDDHFTEKISLDDIVEKSFLSKYHFTRTFKTLYHCSPYQYLLQVRLQKAQQLLAQDYSYREVSELVGFSDSKNLRKAIQKMEGAGN